MKEADVDVQGKCLDFSTKSFTFSLSFSLPQTEMAFLACSDYDLFTLNSVTRLSMHTDYLTQMAALSQRGIDMHNTHPQSTAGSTEMPFSIESRVEEEELWHSSSRKISFASTTWPHQKYAADSFTEQCQINSVVLPRPSPFQAFKKRTCSLVGDNFNFFFYLLSFPSI
uniref:Uncharacterized protein n=1 Tax=Strigamia maritima TaxID=126957 RepID=T1JMA4_STRMM